MFHTRFLSPTDQKCGESSTYWHFFYHRPPGKFRYTVGEIVKMLCQELDTYIIIYIYVYICIHIYDALVNRYRFSISVQPQLDCTTFQFHFMKCLKKKCFLKLKSWQVCDWLDNYVGNYGSKVAEGFSAFQRRSCYKCCYSVLFAILVHTCSYLHIENKVTIIHWWRHSHIDNECLSDHYAAALDLSTQDHATCDPLLISRTYYFNT